MSIKQKKILAAILAATCPIWIVPFVVFSLISSFYFMVYTTICEKMGINE